MLPSGSRIQLRLTSSVSSANARVGDAVGAVVTVDVPLAGGVLPRGTVVRGAVRQVAPFSWAAPQALLWIEFQELLAPGGRTIPIATRLVAVDNARDTVDATGKILGIAPPREAPTSAEDSVSLAAVAPELYDLERVAFRIRELERPEIRLSRWHRHHRRDGDGHSRRSCWRCTGRAESRQVIDRAGAWRNPTRTAAGRPPRPADVVNFAFTGSDEDIVRSVRSRGMDVGCSHSACAPMLAPCLPLPRTVATPWGRCRSRRSRGGRPIVSSRTDEHLRSTAPRTHLAAGRAASRRSGMDRERDARCWRQVRDGRNRTFTHRVETDIDIERQKSSTTCDSRARSHAIPSPNAATFLRAS